MIALTAIRETFRSLRSVLIIAAVLAVAIGLFSTPLHAQDSPLNLTQLGDAEVATYRAEAMAAYYAAQPGRVALTQLGDAEVAAYRADAMAAYYASQRLASLGQLSMSQK